MKTVLLFVAFFLCLQIPVRADDYDDNYQDGYEDGYTYNSGGLKGLSPIPPLSPLPQLGETEEDGFVRGVIDGHEAKERN